MPENITLQCYFALVLESTIKGEKHNVYRAKPLIPVAPRAKQASRNFSIGSDAVCKAFFDFICISVFVRFVRAILQLNLTQFESDVI